MKREGKREERKRGKMKGSGVKVHALRGSSETVIGWRAGMAEGR